MRPGEERLREPYAIRFTQFLEDLRSRRNDAVRQLDGASGTFVAATHEVGNADKVGDEQIRLAVEVLEEYLANPHLPPLSGG